MSIAEDGPRTKGRLPTDLHVASRIRELRLRCRLTQAKAAERIGVKAELWYHFEAGRTKVTVGRLATIAEAFNRSPQWFFQHDNDHRLASDRAIDDQGRDKGS